MKIFLSRTFLKSGDIKFNYEKIKEIYDRSLKDDCDLLIFPEMTITGFPCYDKLLDKEFIKTSNDFLEKLIDYTKDKKTRILLGCPYYIDEINNEKQIKKSELYNSVILINDGYIDAVSSKNNIAKDNLFDEYRYFDKEKILKSITYENDNFDVLIGDDIMESKNIFYIKERDTDFVVCLDAEIEKNIEKKKKQLIKIAKWTNKNIIYLNTLGYDVEKSYKFFGEVFIVDSLGNIEYENKNINNDIIKLNSSVIDGVIKILPSKNNEKFVESNLLDLLSDLYKNKKIVYEIKDKNDKKSNAKNVKMITFEKNLSDTNIEFIDLNKYISGLEINDEIKNIVIKNIFKDCIIFF